MTQWISSLLRIAVSPHTVATVKSDGLLLQVHKVKASQKIPPYMLTLDLRGSSGTDLVRVVEIRAETPQMCATLVTQLLGIAKHGLAHHSN